MAVVTETLQAGSSAPSGTLKPIALCHFVLRTLPETYETMVRWYVDFTGGNLAYFSPTIAMIRYDDEHHRIGIVPRKEAVPRPKDGRPIVGLGHVAFAYQDLDALATSYEQKKKAGFQPVWSINHGPTTSIYWRDPDGNDVETQVDNFDTVAETMAFMESPEFTENPIGVDFDPEDFVRRVRKGGEEQAIKERAKIGPRTTK